MTWLKSTFLAAQLARQSTPQQLQDNMYKICTDTVNQLSRQQFIAVDEKGETNPPLRTLPSVAQIPHTDLRHRHLQLALRSFRWLLSRHATSCAWRQQCSSESSLPAQSHVRLAGPSGAVHSAPNSPPPTETAAVPHAMEHILAEALRVVSRSEEFAERNVRVKEKRELNAINTRDGRFTYEKGKKVTTPAVQCPVQVVRHWGVWTTHTGKSCCRQRSSTCCKRSLVASRWATMHCKVCSHTSRASGSGATHIPQCAIQLRLRQP